MVRFDCASHSIERATVNRANRALIERLLRDSSSERTHKASYFHQASINDVADIPPTLFSECQKFLALTCNQVGLMERKKYYKNWRNCCILSEDAQLLELQQQGISWVGISKRMGRFPASVHLRYGRIEKVQRSNSGREAILA